MAVGRSVCCRENQPRRLGRSIRDVFAEALSFQTGSPSTKPCAPSRNDARGPTRRHTHRPGGRRLSVRPHRQPWRRWRRWRQWPFRGSAAGVCELVCAASGTRLRPPDEDEILAETGRDPRGLKTTPKLRNPAAPVCAPRFKSPPGAADNERKRLSLLQRTLRPRPLVPSAGSLLYRAYSTGYLHRRRLLLPHALVWPERSDQRRFVHASGSLAESARAAAVPRPALDRSQRPLAGAATQAAAEVALQFTAVVHLGEMADRPSEQGRAARTPRPPRSLLPAHVALAGPRSGSD
jgi:hypothetical protein